MPRAERVGVAGIQHLCPGAQVAHHVVGTEQRHGRVGGQQRAAIAGHDLLEVRRLRRQVGGRLGHEPALIGRLQDRIGLPLPANRRHRLRAHRLAAQRPRHMAGVQFHIIGQAQQPLVQAVEQVVRPSPRLDRQVGPPHRADEQRVAGQHQPGSWPCARSVTSQADMLGPVAGRMQRPDLHLAQPDHIAIGERPVR